MKLRTGLRGGTGIALAALLAVAMATPAWAAGLAFASTFSDHMVIQRDRPLRVWGRAAAGQAVTVSVREDTAAVVAGDDGVWRATLPAMKAGGPVTIVATADGERIELSDVLVGDVWLCSGQSNMQFDLKNAHDSDKAAKAAMADTRLRFLTVPSFPSGEIKYAIDAKWTTASAQAANDFSAVAVFFALALREQSPALRDVPIGLIDSSLGGSHVEYWVPPATPLAEADKQNVSLFNVKGGQLYNAMIAPLAGTTLKGVLWYQGESNTPRPTAYAGLLGRMIAQWRRDFQDGELPFYVVQLPNYNDAIDGYSYAWLREAQATVAAKDAHVKLAVTLGTPDGYDLHPRYKRLVGERLALLARRLSYGEDVVAESPTFKTATADGAAMRVTFDTHGSTLKAGPEGLLDFELAGQDGVFYSAAAEIAGADSVLVHSDRVPTPAFVRYAWQAAPHATLINAAGLPAGPFRTDTAPPTPMLEVQPAPPPFRVATKRYAATISPGGWLTGLMVEGRQMLNADHQGGLVPLSGFGPFPLSMSTPIGPAQIAFDDGNLRFTYRFDDSGAAVDVHNGNADGEVTAGLMLAVDAKLDGPFAAGQAATFSRGNATLLLGGFDRCTNTGNGYDLQFATPAGTTRTITLRLATGR